MKTLSAGLFSVRPMPGSKNPPGELSYRGYKRVSVRFDERGKNMDTIQFEPFPASGSELYVAVLDNDGVVVASTSVVMRTPIAPPCSVEVLAGVSLFQYIQD